MQTLWGLCHLLILPLSSTNLWAPPPILKTSVLAHNLSTPQPCHHPTWPLKSTSPLQPILWLPVPWIPCFQSFLAPLDFSLQVSWPNPGAGRCHPTPWPHLRSWRQTWDSDQAPRHLMPFLLLLFLTRYPPVPCSPAPSIPYNLYDYLAAFWSSRISKWGCQVFLLIPYLPALWVSICTRKPFEACVSSLYCHLSLTIFPNDHQLFAFHPIHIAKSHPARFWWFSFST